MASELVNRFESVQQVRDGLRDINYLADDGIAELLTSPTGWGSPFSWKVLQARARHSLRNRLPSLLELAYSSAVLRGYGRIKGIVRMELQEAAPAHSGRQASDSWTDIHDDIFSDEFLLTRPLLEAITADDPVVLLIDEVDRVEVETEALLLEILSEYQVSIPELGTIEAKQIPLVFLTSNNTRELSEALKRRCLFLHVDYPSMEREREIVLAKVPGVTESLAEQIARVVRSIRSLDLKKAPSVSETLDWAEHCCCSTSKPSMKRLQKRRCTSC